MTNPITKEERREQEIMEQRGLHQASSFISKKIKELIKNNEPVSILDINEAHKILFEKMGGKDAGIGGMYRKSNDIDLKRKDGTFLPYSDWKNIANDMSILNENLKNETKNLNKPRTKSQYKKIIEFAAKLSHRLASIHPFENGNGRASRLLLSSILLRADLYFLEKNATEKKREKSKYLNAMRQADDGDLSLLNGIISNSLLETERRLIKERKRKQAKK
jgi:Fic family protein